MHVFRSARGGGLGECVFVRCGHPAIIGGTVPCCLAWARGAGVMRSLVHFQGMEMRS